MGFIINCDIHIGGYSDSPKPPPLPPSPPPPEPSEPRPPPIPDSPFKRPPLRVPISEMGGGAPPPLPPSDKKHVFSNAKREPPRPQESLQSGVHVSDN